MLKNKNEFNVKDYLHIVVRRKWTALLVFLSITAPLVFFVSTLPDTYLAKAQLVIEDLKGAATDIQVLRPTRSFNFYQGVLRSRSFLQAVVDTIGGFRFREFVKDTSAEAVRTFVGASVSLRPTSYESFVELTAVAPKPQMAFDLAQASTAVFRALCREVVATETENTVKETENQLNIIREKLATAERDFREFSEKLGSSSMGTTTELKHLQDKYYELKSERAGKEALAEANQSLLRMLQKKLEPKNIDTRRQADFARIQRELKDKEKEKQRLESLGLTLAAGSQLNRDIEDLEREVLKLGGTQEQERVDPKVLSQWQKMRKVVVEDEMELEILANKISVYDRKIDEYKKKHPDELSQTLELARLERSRKVYEDTYNLLLEKVEVAKIRRAAETGGVAVIDKPFYPNAPLPKKQAAYYVVGMIVALFLSVGLVILLETLDTTVRSTDELENQYHLSVIGTIPHIDISRKSELQIRRKSASSGTKEIVTVYPRELIDFYKDESVISEAYRSLRTNLFFTSPDKPLKTLVVTSSGPHEGKSLTTSNLALACAQMGKKVLLIDSDLRRPVLHHLFQLTREHGFTDLFMSDEVSGVVKVPGIENLHVITAGRFTPSPSELLASKKLERLLEGFKAQYDLVLFDTPPVMAVTDATLLSTKVDGVLLIVKSYQTDRNILDRAVATIQNVNTRIVGFVLNDIDLSHRYASYGYYKYYYHYYRSQKD